jgi:hypothetical protein
VRLARAVAVAAVVTVAAACGQRSADLFVVERSGSIPGARLSLHVSDDGTARCNRGERRRLADPQLLTARQLARELEPLAARRLSLPAARGSVLRYRVRLATGVVTFSDNSPGLRPAMARTQAFTRSVATATCGLAR